MNLFLDLSGQFPDAFDGRMLDFLQSFRLGRFNLLRKPEALNQVEAQHSGNDDYQQDFSHVAKVANQSHHGATEKVTDTAENGNPYEAAGQRQRDKTQIAHARDAIERARRPSQSVNVLRNKD